MYLPATLGLCPLFAMAIRRIPQNIRFYSLAFIFISLSVLTAERNKVWVDELQLWKDVLEKSPNSPLPYTNLGKAYYDKGDHGKALAFMKKSIEMNGLVETSHYNLANIYMDMDRLILSEKEYRRTIEINPKHYQSYLGLGSIQNQTGKLQEAEISYLKAIEIRSTKIAQDEDYSLARINLGEVYGKMGRFEDSIRESQAAVKLTPNSFKAYYNIGTANIKLNRLEKSVEAFLKCLDINSKFENALFNLAFVYQKLNQFENSNLYFSKFLEIKKSFPKAHILMGINYAQMNKITESIKSFKKAIILDPKNLNARTYLAKAFAQKGNFDEAIKHLEIALKQNPNLNSIRIQLSLMYWKNQNQPLEAKKLLQMALQFSGNPEERLKISHWLQELSE
jgi:tetratricopeptide (TPR) repeat protein